MRNRQEWFNEKMAALLTIGGGGYNRLVISNITEFCRGFRKEFRGFSRAC